MKKYLVLTILLFLAACRRDEPPAPTAEQSAQLNEAEEMLNDLAEDGSDQPNASNAANATRPTTISNGTENRSQGP